MWEVFPPWTFIYFLYFNASLLQNKGICIAFLFQISNRQVTSKYQLSIHLLQRLFFPWFHYMWTKTRTSNNCYNPHRIDLSFFNKGNRPVEKTGFSQIYFTNFRNIYKYASFCHKEKIRIISSSNDRLRIGDLPTSLS